MFFFAFNKGFLKGAFNEHNNNNKTTHIGKTSTNKKKQRHITEKTIKTKNIHCKNKNKTVSGRMSGSGLPDVCLHMRLWFFGYANRQQQRARGSNSEEQGVTGFL